jgi:hypothetical protein
LIIIKTLLFVCRINTKKNEVDENDRQRKHSVDTFKFSEHGQRWSKVYQLF